MAQSLHPDEFLLLSRTLPVIDVRSESEFAQGHIPGALNLPVFNDEERACVGKLYKKSGREASVLKGLELAGPKLAGFIKQLHGRVRGKQVLVHCWRGGMRSESMAWLFELAGYQVGLLLGGYKAFRNYLHEYFSRNWKFIVIGGKTGSGKTDLLYLLKNQGEQVIDLEALAHHKGSAFGGRPDGFQPTNEQFYNDLFAALVEMDPDKVIWLEDESRNIGRVSVPEEIFFRMMVSPLLKIEEPAEKRIRRLVGDYASLPAGFLEECLLKIGEKLGGTRLKAAREALTEGNFDKVVSISLEYYDKAYEHTLSLRNPSSIIPAGVSGKEEIPLQVLFEFKERCYHVTDLS
ncbi:MAG: tRNA 2-selenouridine(34) synthase MnmH [Syntrophothermus sp.]